MDGFWMEMHCHCATGSGCAKVAPELIPGLYVKEGYSGIVITDHFCLKLQEKGSREEYKRRVDRAVTGYHIAKDIAPEGFTVLLGAEMSLSTQTGENHFLTYGLTEDFLYKSFDMTEMTIEEFSEYLHKNGMMVYQAHPYRGNCFPNDPRFLDGIEAMNDPRSKLPDNTEAEKWAKAHSMPMISGSDFHEVRACASGGVCFDVPILSNEDLLRALKNHSYSKIKKNSDY